MSEMSTWEDVLRMPDDGNRYEFIGGQLYMTPAPVTRYMGKENRTFPELWCIRRQAGNQPTATPG